MAKAILRVGKVAASVVILLALLAGIISSVKMLRPAVAEVSLSREIIDPNSLALDVSARAEYAFDTAVPSSYAELVGLRNKNTRVWRSIEEVEVVDSITGEVTFEQRTSTIREVGGGICYKNTRGKWQVTDTAWVATADGFVMDKAGYALEIGKTAGSVMSHFVDGRRLDVRPWGLVADDGNVTANIAMLDDSVVGQIDVNSPNKLVFFDAFGTGVDLEIESKPGGYHQNVIFRQKPTLPQDFDPAATKMQLFTEMDLDTYENSKTGTVGLQLGRRNRAQAQSDPNSLSIESAFEEVAVSQLARTQRSRGNIRFVSDNQFGNQSMGHFLGRSDIFAIENTADGDKNVRIATAEKEFIHDTTDGKTYLIETLDAAVLEQATYPVIWDYHSVSGTLSGSATWKSGQTYYVSSTLTVTGTLTIESGAVVKLGSGTSIDASSGTLIAQGKPYLPIIFTSMNDNSIGDVIPGSNGSPSIWDHSGIKIGSGSEFEFCVVRYASVALTIYDYPAEAIQNNVITGCSEGICADIDSYGPEPAAGDLYILNNLISNRGYSDADAGISILSDIGTSSTPPFHCTTNVYNNTLEACDIGVYVCQSGYLNLVNIYNCLFVNCSSYGAWNDSSSSSIIAADHNAFFDVGTDYSGIYGGNNNLSPLSANPYYYDAITLEYTYYLNQAGGAVDKGSHDDGMSGFTTAINNSDDINEIDIGYHHSCQNPYSDAVTWYVDVAGDDNNGGSNTSPFRTIQYAIDVASYRDKGEEVIIKEGTYYENIRFKGVDIDVKSEDGIADHVTIHGDGLSPVVSFEGSETSNCELTGVTVRSDDVAMPASEDLIHRWELAGDAMDSVSTIEGALQNGAGFSLDDCRSTVLDLDSSTFDYVNIQGCDGIAGTSSRTCSAWIKTNGISATQRTIVSWGVHGRVLGEWWIMRVTATGYLNLKVGGGLIDTTTYLADNQWHHVAIVHDENASQDNITFYVDGTATTTGTVADINTSVNGTVAIGVFEGSRYFDGSISDVRIYDTALDASQIRQMCNDTAASLITGVDAYWGFDEVLDGSTAADSSDYGRDGTLDNPTVITKADYKVGFGSLELNGTGENVEISGSTAWKGIGGGQARTCSAWIKTSTIGQNMAIVSWGETNYPGSRWIFRVSSSGLLNLKVGGALTGSIDLTDGKWHHVAVTLADDGSPNVNEAKLYVDGVEDTYTLITDTPINTDTLTSPPNVEIGSYDSIGNYFSGLIDDVRIYDRALTSDEIKKLASSGNGIDGKGATATISNCIITNNTADNGGGILNLDGDIVNCTITGNKAIAGGGLYDCGGTIKNSIIWGNASTDASVLDQQIKGIHPPNVLYSCVQDDDPTDAASYTFSYTGMEQSMLGYWKMDEETGLEIEDSSQYENNGVAVRTANNMTIDGVINTAFEFNGTDDNISVEDASPELSFGDKDFSISVWFKTSDSVSIRYIMRQHDSSGVYYSVYTWPGGSMFFVVHDGTNYVDPGSGPGVCDGEWHHLVAVFDRSGTQTASLYIDNELKANPRSIAAIGNIDNEGMLWIGSNESGGQNWDGSLDDLMIFDKALSVSEINGLYNQGEVNIDSHPYFVDAEAGDYHLQEYSYCIDAGDDSDCDNEPEDNGDRINMGAYGNTFGATVLNIADTTNGGNGLPDSWEAEYSGTALDGDGDADADSDGLTDLKEYQLGTDPTNSDSDGDGLSDGDEVDYYHTDPSSSDTDLDGMDDGWEVANGLDPLNQSGDDSILDADGDGVTNAQEYEVSDPLHHNIAGTIIEYDYDDAGNITQTTVSNPQGDVLAISEHKYDELGRKYQEQHWKNIDSLTEGQHNSDADAITLTRYDDQNRVLMTINKIDPVATDYPDIPKEDDLVIKNMYDDLGRIDYIDVGTYDEAGSDITDIKRTDYQYDTNGNLWKVSAQYDPTATSPNPDYGPVYVIINAYDNAGRVSKVTDANGNYRTTEYDSFGQTIRTTAYEYVAGGTDTEEMRVRMEYDDLGRVVHKAVMASASDATTVAPTLDVSNSYYKNNMVTTYTYADSTNINLGQYHGRLLKQESYYGSINSSDAKIAKVEFTYDDVNRTTETKEYEDGTTLKKTVTAYYDEMNRVVTQQETSENPVTPASKLIITTAIQYNHAGRVARQIQKDDPADAATWQITRYAYDAMGNVLSQVKPDETVAVYSYDALGRTEMSIADYGLDPDNLNQRTIYAYDRQSRKASITAYADPTVAQTTSYSHDDINNKLTITYSDNTEMEYEYYANGAVKTRTNQNGWLTTYAYDDVGNLETKITEKTSMPTVEESYTYDTLNRMKSAKREDDSTEISNTAFTYNTMNKLLTSIDTYAGVSAKTTTYAYDQAGNRIETLYPDASTRLAVVPDFMGRIATIGLDTDNNKIIDNTIASYQYIGDRVAKRAYPTTTPVNANYEYDNFGRVTDIYTTNATARDSKVDFNLAYKPDTSSIEEITFNHRNSESNDFSYDNLNRLTDVEYLDNANDTEAFAMDLLGNRESVTIDGGTPETYAVDDTTNRYNESIGSYTITLGYDTAGNTTTDQNGYQYSYDYDNHITEIKDNLSALVATFTYDALGRRIEKYDAKAAVTTRYYYDNNRVLLEVEDSGSGFADARYFVYGNYIDEVLMMTDVDSDNSVTDGDYYYGHDQLFSPVALFDDTGSVKERYEYDAYGKTTVMDLNFVTRSVSNYANPYLFTGRRLDILDNGSLKIYYYRARNYDPDTGRFLQHDPFGYVDGMNLYEYVSSNPATYADPMGLYEVDEMINTFVENYGAEGTAMLAMAMYDGWYIDKADYWLDDWDYQSDGTLGIASSWWGGIDDSKETAAKQLHDALYNKYGGALSEFMKVAAKCICHTHQANQNEDLMDLLRMTNFAYFIEGESQRIATEAAKGGAYFQRLAEDELKMYLCGFAAGAIVSKGADAFDGWNDLNRARKAAAKVDDAASGYNSFRAFKRAEGAAGQGQAWHHIVEQNPSNINKFGPEKIHNINNIVPLSNGKGSIHARVSGYYSSKPYFTGGLTVRQWLSGYSYEYQYNFGIEVIEFYRGAK